MATAVFGVPSYTFKEEAMLASIASFKKEEALEILKARELRAQKRLDDLRAAREVKQAMLRVSFLEAEVDREEMLQIERESELLKLKDLQAKPGEIAHIVAEVFGVDLRQVMGPSRQRPCTLARHALSYLLITRLGWSLPRIGKMLRRHHTTILHSSQVISKLRTELSDFDARVTSLEERFPVVFLGR